MTFDELQNKWQSQRENFKLSIDSDVLLKQVKRNKRNFESTIFWRDIREVGVAFLMIIFFLYVGIKNNLWPMWLLAIVSLWVGVFMVVDRLIQKKRQPKFSENLKGCIKNSLWQINHQIWLLKSVLWWYLAPPGIGCLIWFGYCGISIIISNHLHIGWLLFILGGIVGMIFLYWGIYCLNQRAVRKELVPRKDELEDLLNSM